MKHLFIITLIFGLTISCASHKYSPELQKLINEDNLVNSIGALQNTAIGLHSENKLSTNDTRLVVTFTVESLKLIRDKELGWNLNIRTRLSELRSVVPSEQFKSILDLINAILSELK